MTHRQQRFIQEYLISGNATEAYKKAGYKVQSDNAAAVNGARLLRDAQVKLEIERHRGVLAEYVEADAKKIVTEYTYSGHYDAKDLFYETKNGIFLKPLDQWPAKISRAIAGMKIKRETNAKVIVKCPHCLEPINEIVEQPIEIFEVKLNNKLAALHDLAEHTGVLEPGSGITNVNVQVNIEDVMRAREEAIKFRQQVIDQKKEEKNGDQQV